MNTEYGFSTDGRFAYSKGMTYCMMTGKRYWNGICDSIVYSPNREYCIEQENFGGQVCIYHITSKIPCFRSIRNSHAFFLNDSHILLVAKWGVHELKIVNIFTREETVISKNSTEYHLNANTLLIYGSHPIAIDVNTLRETVCKVQLHPTPESSIIVLSHNDTSILITSSIKRTKKIELLDYNGKSIGSHTCETSIHSYWFRLSPMNNCVAYLWSDIETRLENLNRDKLGKLELRIYDFDIQTLTCFELNFAHGYYHDTIYTSFAWNSDGESLNVFVSPTKVQQITKTGKVLREVNLVYEPIVVENRITVLENRIKYLESLIHSHVVGPITEYDSCFEI